MENNIIITLFILYNTFSYRNMKIIYKIIQPVILFQIASVSSLVILLSTSQIMVKLLQSTQVCCYLHNYFYTLDELFQWFFIVISNELQTCFLNIIRNIAYVLHLLLNFLCQRTSTYSISIK